MGFNPLKGGRTKKYDGKLHADETTLIFNKKVRTSTSPHLPFLSLHLLSLPLA